MLLKMAEKCDAKDVNQCQTITRTYDFDGLTIEVLENSRNRSESCETKLCNSFNFTRTSDDLLPYHGKIPNPESVIAVQKLDNRSEKYYANCFIHIRNSDKVIECRQQSILCRCHAIESKMSSKSDKTFSLLKCDQEISTDDVNATICDENNKVSTTLDVLFEMNIKEL